jgi:COP9 signalosome complex subunit 8
MDFADATSILNDLDSQVKKLEEIELRDQDQTSEDVFKHLLIYYLLKDEVIKAKFLWKRLPAQLKQNRTAEESELVRLWNIAVLIIKRHHVQIFGLVNRYRIGNGLQFFSSQELNDLLCLLVEKTRDRLFELVTFAYTSISVDELAQLVGLSNEEVIRDSLKREWCMDDTKSYLLPRAKTTTEVLHNPNREQMQQLTSLVSYLESL